MEIFNITSSSVESLKIDCSKIKQIDANETIIFSSSAQIKLPIKDDYKDMPYYAKINVSFTGKDGKESYFDMVYVCEITKMEDVVLSEEDTKNKLQHLVKEEIYPKVQKYIDEFYRISNIDFIPLPPIDEGSKD